MKSWIEISAARLAENYAAARSVLARETQAGDAALLAVIKADAYGHDAALCAPVLARAGAEWLGVTDAAEGIEVLKALGAEAKPRILIMCGLLAEDAATIVRHRLTPVVWTRAQMQALAEAASEAEPLKIHLEIDSGMSRQGVPPGAELRETLRWLATEPRLCLEGVMTHFASAEETDPTQTLRQRERFTQAIGEIAASGLRPAWVHAGNTSGIDNGVSGQGETLRWLAGQARRIGARVMSRAGLALYGYALPVEGHESEERLRCALKPVMTWKTRVTAVREIAPGERVGYNGMFHVEHSMRLALVPVGYADGLCRELSGTPAGGWVMIHGQRAPIVGRISMNLTTVDVTQIEGVVPGDEAILLGEGVTAEDHAALARTIAYEILCGMRCPRVLV